MYLPEKKFMVILKLLCILSFSFQEDVFGVAHEKVMDCLGKMSGMFRKLKKKKNLKKAVQYYFFGVHLF